MSLQVAFKAPIQLEACLKSYSTFKIGGIARFLSEPTTRDELTAALQFQQREKLPLLVVGRGSNLLFSDRGFSGLVLSLRRFESDDIFVERGEWVRAAAGVSLFRLAAFTQTYGLSGAEFLCHIPGAVGGAVLMNSGFFNPGNRLH